MKTVGNRIKERRKELGLTAEDLGKRIEKDRATIYRYENGDIEKLPLNVLTPLADALYTSPDYLMGWTDDPNDTVIDSNIPKNNDEDRKLLSAYHAADPSVQKAIRLMLGMDHVKKED